MITGTHVQAVRAFLVDDDLVFCVPAGVETADALEAGEVWAFDLATGRETNVDLQVGPRWQTLGSRLLILDE